MSSLTNVFLCGLRFHSVRLTHQLIARLNFIPKGKEGIRNKAILWDSVVKLYHLTTVPVCKEKKKEEEKKKRER